MNRHSCIHSVGLNRAGRLEQRRATSTFRILAIPAASWYLGGSNRFMHYGFWSLSPPPPLTSLLLLSLDPSPPRPLRSSLLLSVADDGVLLFWCVFFCFVLVRMAYSFWIILMYKNYLVATRKTKSAGFWQHNGDRTDIILAGTKRERLVQRPCCCTKELAHRHSSGTEKEPI